MSKSLQNIAKTVVLLHEEHFCDVCWLAPKNIEKCSFESSKTCPRPRKIESRVTKNPKKRTNMSKKSSRSAPEAAKSEKKAPKSQQSANIVPNMPRSDLDLEAPPPKGFQAGVSEGIHAVGFNTPSAARSAADLEAQEAPKSNPKTAKKR